MERNATYLAEKLRAQGHTLGNPFRHADGSPVNIIWWFDSRHFADEIVTQCDALYAVDNRVYCIKNGSPKPVRISSQFVPEENYTEQTTPFAWT